MKRHKFEADYHPRPDLLKTKDATSSEVGLRSIAKVEDQLLIDQSCSC